MSLRVLVFAPHPDDEVLGCGGAIARHASKGDPVCVAILTNAAVGAPEIYSPDYVTRIRKEARQAHNKLGVHSTVFEELPAPRLDSIPNYQIAEVVAKIIQVQQPDIVYVPHGGDRHLDHWAVSQAVQVACRPNSECGVRRLLAYETLSETEWGDVNAGSAFVPNWFMDISGFVDRKLRAMEQYNSQLKSFPHPRSLSAIEALAMWRGASAGFEAAEAFMLIRQRDYG
jgi:LmbE family N-acetylglucosaminyl deacetylase